MRAALLALVCASLPILAATQISQIPLATLDGRANIKPNLQFILDDSGSMAWDFTPDWVHNSGYQCPRSSKQDRYGRTITMCLPGEVPYASSSFNSQYYNPDIRYQPPQRMNAAGSMEAMPNANPLAAYNSASHLATGSTVNLTTNFHDIEYCTTPSGSTCQRNSSSYQYPDATYRYPRQLNPLFEHGGNAGDGSRYFRDNGSNAWIYIFNRSLTVNPFYYRMSGNISWCTSPSDNLNCGTLRTATRIYPKFTAVTFSRVNIVPGSSYSKTAGRTDCLGASTCSYTEELQNFANWYQYYRTRMLMMKTATSQAFSTIGDNFRVGFSVITKGSSFGTDSRSVADLDIADFATSQKRTWYERLFSASAFASTPLRSALNRAGQRYAGTLSGASDPVQYACQRNYTLLTTDGMWNDAFSGVGDADQRKPDGSLTGHPYQDNRDGDSQSYSNTLADIAAYYYYNDLRPSMPGELTATPEDPLTHLHMNTFTLGLGVDGNYRYHPDYQTAGSSLDYDGLRNGTLSWPQPIANTLSTVDDLWHAAVNGRGKYFSARNPSTLTSSLTEALTKITQQKGAGAAAATSTLEPVAGDNFIYLAEYFTRAPSDPAASWAGELKAIEIDSSGSLKPDPVWTSQAQLDTLAASASPTSNTVRRIYTIDPTARRGDLKRDLLWANLSTAEKALFATSVLSQCVSGCAPLTAEQVFNFVARGSLATAIKDKLRPRSHVLGDIVDTQPLYVSNPKFDYTENDYTSFKTAQANRAKRVYVSANDGMLHAINADSGAEAWAYVPGETLAVLPKLADVNYQDNHRYFVNGPLAVADAYFGASGRKYWRTVLVGGMGAGGRSYFALDISDPDNPILLWEFKHDQLGLTFGNPIISKREDGNWIVAFGSGHNNPDGIGRLFIVDLETGVQISGSPISTGVGTAANPSGLSKLNAWLDNGAKENKARWIYGGDLYGNLWRFDFNDTILPAGLEAFKLVATGQAITTKPELAYSSSGHRLVLFGTGRFLGIDDRTNVQGQSVYSITDHGSSSFTLADTTITDPRGSNSPLVKQAVSNVAGSSPPRRNVGATAAEVDLSLKRGCYFDLIDRGERVNVDPKLQLGTLVVLSNIPKDSICAVGGSSWIYQVNYQTCAQANKDSPAGEMNVSSLLVGTSIVKVGGKALALVRTAAGDTVSRGLGDGSAKSDKRRVSWREIIDN